jgi:hypothetical protein
LELTHSENQIVHPTFPTIAMGCAACLVLFAAAAYGWLLDCSDVLRFQIVRSLGGIKERPTGDALKHAKVTMDCLLAFGAALGAILLLLNILIGVS